MTFKPYSKEQQLNRSGGLASKDLQKYQARSIKWLKEKATKVFNEYIRERDREKDHFTCISSGNVIKIKVDRGSSNYHAGHYYSAGEYQMLRYDEVNVNGQSLQQNYYSGDHLIGYREGIIKKWGIDQLKRLETIAAFNKRVPKKWTKIELIEIIQKYTRKLKDLKTKNYSS